MAVQKPPPNFIFKIAVYITDFLHWLADAITPPPAVLMTKLTAFMGSAVIFEAANLGITESLGNGKEWMSVTTLAPKLGLDNRILTRLLRILHQNGVYDLQEKNGQVFVRNNAVSLTLHPDSPVCMKYMALHQGKDVMPVVNDSDGGIDFAMKNAHDPSRPTAFKRKYSLDAWSWMKANPDRSEVINKAMQAVDTMGAGAMVEDHNWGQYKRVLDVGGGTGHFLFNILQTYKQIPQGLVCDLPKAIEDGEKQFAEKCKLEYKGNAVASPLGGIKSRVQFQIIDLFDKDTLPKAKDRDCFMLRAVLHDFIDRDVKLMLPNLRAAFGNAKATLVLVELIPEIEPPNSIQGSVAMIDTIMLCLNGGGERTPHEWKALFSEAGFKLKSWNRTRSPFSMIIAEPV